MFVSGSGRGSLLQVPCFWRFVRKDEEGGGVEGCGSGGVILVCIGH